MATKGSKDCLFHITSKFLSFQAMNFGMINTYLNSGYANDKKHNWPNSFLYMHSGTCCLFFFLPLSLWLGRGARFDGSRRKALYQRLRAQIAQDTFRSSTGKRGTWPGELAIHAVFILEWSTSPCSKMKIRWIFCCSRCWTVIRMVKRSNCLSGRITVNGTQGMIFPRTLNPKCNWFPRGYCAGSAESVSLFDPESASALTMDGRRCW